MIAQAYVIIPKALTKYRHLVAAAGYEHEDATQELVVVFAKRLQGTHPFDPMRLRLTSYLHMLVESVLLNRIARRQRRQRGLGVLAAHHRGRTAELDLEALFPDLHPFVGDP